MTHSLHLSQIGNLPIEGELKRTENYVLGSSDLAKSAATPRVWLLSVSKFGVRLHLATNSVTSGPKYPYLDFSKILYLLFLPFWCNFSNFLRKIPMEINLIY
jgi:hypothetical protein